MNQRNDQSQPLVERSQPQAGAIDKFQIQEQANLDAPLSPGAQTLQTHRCLHQRFEDQVEKDYGAVAVCDEKFSLTYGELNERANKLAHYLCEQGVGPDVLVGIGLDRTTELVVGILAILKAGGAYLPIDLTYPKERVEYMLSDSRATVLLSQRSLVEGINTGQARVICVEEDAALIAKKSKSNPTTKTAPENLAYVIYTSGSTGKPKGVQIEHRAVINFLDSMRRKPGLKASDTVLAITTLSFDIAGLELHLPLTTGARVVIAPWQTAVDGSALIQTIRQQRITLMQATPATWWILLAAGWEGTPNMKILCGGEPLPPELARELIPRCSELWNMYGPTETTIWSTCCRVTDPKCITIGSPIENTPVHIVDSDLNPVPAGTSGELLIGGAGLARGYLNQPELTAAKFINLPALKNQRFYRTGDLARLREDGEFECFGRLDFQVKIRGFRIELGEIETVLAQHPHVRQAVVVAKDTASGDKRLVGYLIALPGVTISLSELRDHARGKLPDYMLPTAFVILKAYPLTPNGKVDRKQLPDPTDNDFADSYPINPPANATEERLSKIWCHLLNVPSIGRHQNFFELGGTSLLAASVFAEIEKQFNRHLPLAALFDHPTLASLAIQLNTPHKTGNTWPSLIPINAKGTNPRFFCVHGAGGNVLLYRSLAEHLGDEYPVYGLQSRGLDRKLPPLRTIEEMAAWYVAEVQHVQPHGPYHLGGYCLGGAIALEMARLLLAKGESVPLIAMLDSYNPALALETSRGRFIYQRLKFHLKNFISLRPSEIRNYLTEKIRVARDGEFKKVFALPKEDAPHPPLKGDSKDDNTQFDIQAINDHAISIYQPKPVNARLTLFKPKTNYSAYPDPLLGWGKIALGGNEICELPINPHAMLVEPFVEHLASALKLKLSQAQVPKNT